MTTPTTGTTDDRTPGREPAEEHGTRTRRGSRRQRLQSRISARVRILLWLLAVMAVALTAVATTTHSIMLRDTEQRITRLLAQETGEFANFVERGKDPDTGDPFTTSRRLLRVFLERQYSDPDEELLGTVGDSVIRQRRDLPTPLPLYQDRDALCEIARDPSRSGTLERPEGEIRWSKVEVEPDGANRSPGTFIVAFHADREQQRAGNVFRLLLGISGVALLLTSGIAWGVAGRILAPVRLVRTTAAQLTEQDLTRRIPVHGRDDVSALAETFNSMLDRLERAFAAQRQFVDDAGHELRTPITIVRGHLELMEQDSGPEGAREREETVRVVTDELDRMSRIVEDLLLLAKVERPDFVSPEPVELAELTADVFVKVRTLAPEGPERPWELAEVAEGTVWLDPQRVTQAMVQLAQNAVQHTPPRTPIRVGSRRTAEGEIELYVADRGPGIGEDDVERIFERFRRGAARRGARGSGAGLGLAIVRAIAEGHPSGRVELRETPEGGATFVLVLPGGPTAPSRTQQTQQSGEQTCTGY